jgi:hypothetical protein
MKSSEDGPLAPQTIDPTLHLPTSHIDGDSRNSLWRTRGGSQHLRDRDMLGGLDNRQVWRRFGSGLRLWPMYLHVVNLESGSHEQGHMAHIVMILYLRRTAHGANHIAEQGTPLPVKSLHD